MKIQKFQVVGLFGCRDLINIDFTDNIHVLSGKNGAGKTTILKLIWYFISGNLEKALIEVPFKEATIKTDLYTLKVVVNEDQEIPFETTLTYHAKSLLSQDIAEINPDELNSHIRHVLTKFIGTSFFFPTFRNIEGGFTTEKYDIKHELFQHLLLNNRQKNPDNINLIDDFRILSKKLSNKDHKFIASISASNINDLLIGKYAEIMSLIQPYEEKRKELSNNIFQSFDFKDGEIFLRTNADQDQVHELQEKISSIEEQINEIRKPLKRFHDSIKFFLKDYQFNFGHSVQFTRLDQTKNLPKRTKLQELLGIVAPESLLDISILSAGEKQILTLIGYNAIYDNTIFFIDEPEISLHADWQRILFRILMKQNPSNQFIISTQSPFIYSKYPRNEVCVDPQFDRGDSENH